MTILPLLRPARRPPLPAPQRRAAAQRILPRGCLPFALALHLAACSQAAPPIATPNVAAAAPLAWEELMPPDDQQMRNGAMAFALSRIDHNATERAPQFGSFKTVDALDGRRISLGGYVVPLETDEKGLMSEFFFVPSLGACIHVPPPPPNQMIYVQLAEKKPAPDLTAAQWLAGTLHTHKHDAEIASAAYSVDDANLSDSAPATAHP